MLNFYPTFPNLFPNQMNMGTAQQSIQYVDGLQGAEQISLPPNSSGVYLDNNKKDMYIIHTDANGKSTVQTCYYKEKEKEKPKEYITRDEFEKFKAGLKGGVKHESNASSATKGE